MSLFQRVRSLVLRSATSDLFQKVSPSLCSRRHGRARDAGMGWTHPKGRKGLAGGPQHEKIKNCTWCVGSGWAIICTPSALSRGRADSRTTLLLFIHTSHSHVCACEDVLVRDISKQTPGSIPWGVHGRLLGWVLQFGVYCGVPRP